MRVRCGRCQVELEVAGAGEFACPNCGARNMVRGPGDAPAGPLGADPLGGVPDLGAPNPFGTGTSSPPPSDEPPEGIDWIRCPSCSYRFAVGDVDEVSCPTCSAKIELRNGVPNVQNES